MRKSKMADESNSGLLIAALVAIVAVVGLVILFKGGAAGAYVQTLPQGVCPGNYWIYQMDSSSPTGYWHCTTSGRSVPANIEQQV
jgi:hypothetical protein